MRSFGNGGGYQPSSHQPSSSHHQSLRRTLSESLKKQYPPDKTAYQELEYEDNDDDDDEKDAFNIN